MGSDVQSSTILPLPSLNRLQWAAIVFVTALFVAGGLILHGLSLAALQVAVLPGFVSYLAIARRHSAFRLRYYHLLYIVLLAAFVLTYLLLLANAIPQLQIRWIEWPIALWFLLTIHVMVWLMDRVVDMILSKAFGLTGPRVATSSTRRRFVLKTSLRGLCILALAGPYILAMFAVHWVKFSDNTDPMRQCQADFEQVRIRAADGLGLDGWFIPPVLPPGYAGGPSDATVIVVPDRGTPKGCSLNFAQTSFLHGYNVLLLDLRGEGGSAGHTRSFGLREANDVLGAVQYLKQTHKEASRYVYAMGISHGASAVIHAAAIDERIRAVVLDGTITLRNAVLPRRILQELPEPFRTYLDTMTRAFASAELGCNLFREQDLATDIAKLSPRPLLIFHESADSEADPEQATRLFEAAGDPKCLCMIPGAVQGRAFMLAGNMYTTRVLQLLALARELDTNGE